MKRVVLALAVCSSLIACSKTTDDGFLSLSPDEQAQLFQERNIADFGLRGTKKLVLTFDDGPTPGVTDVLLDVLAKERVQATFFMVGRNIPGNEKLLLRMRNEGHILANHSMRHISLSKNEFIDDPDKVIWEIEKTHDLIAPYMKASQRLYFRAPHGAWSKFHPYYLNKISKLQPYIGPIFWTIGGEMNPRPVKGTPYDVTSETIRSAADWHCWSLRVSVATCYAGYMNEIERHQGGVILFHDKNINTVKMVQLMIPELKRRGYEFISLDDVQNLDKYL